MLSRALEDLSPNESGVLYIDAGCSMNLRTAEARRRFQQYLEASDSSGGLFFRLNGNNSHASYTKKSVLDKLGSREMAVENLVAATTFFLARSAEARVFLERWSNLMSLDDYEHLLDPTMQELQTEDFVAHRHDQSLLSIVLREFNFAIVPDETYFSPNWRTHGRDFPIWATRIRSAFPFVSENFAMKVIRRLERAIFK